MQRVKRIALCLLAALMVALVLLLILPQTYHLRRAIIHTYPKIDQYPIFENRVVAAGDPRPWPVAHDYGRYEIDPELAGRFAELETVAFVVVRQDSLLFEQYWDGYGPASRSNSFSMAKSIVSLLVGIAIEEGYILGLDQPVSDFLTGFGDYDGQPLTIEHLLTMSAGIRWDEGYSGLFSPTTEAYYGRDLPGLVGRIRQDSRPGERFYYQSGVTQMLGLILEKATGRTISEYASEKLWTPMGAEHDALWSLDRANGTEKAYCCFNSNARDFARFGRLMLGRGEWDGRFLVPSWYMDKALNPAAWLLSEDGEVPNMQYGYQFWILQRDGVRIPYMRGILGQYVFALPEHDAVVVRLGRRRSEVRTSQNYPDDIDTWLDAGMAILGR
ncbi:MAG: beta-lactamase family protein [Rikenellaceae bacterium]|nr:beta-lactamase family protein [Rikenellaceae bacterium]